MPYISKITLPGSNEPYDIKDAEARSAIANMHTFNYSICTQASDTPYGVQWDNGGTTVTGTLAASADTMYKIYLVPQNNATGDYYDEYLTVNPSGSTYSWEKFGSTQADIDNLGDLAYKDTESGSYTPAGSNADSSVTFDTSGHTADAITALPTSTVPKAVGATKYLKTSTTAGSTSKLVTTSKYVASSEHAGAALPTFQMGTGDASETLVIGAGTLPTFAAQTMATGSLANDASGASVKTGDPTVSLTSDSSTSTGAIAYTESVSESGTNNVSFGTPTTAPVLKSDVTATAAGQTFTGTQATITVS